MSDIESDCIIFTLFTILLTLAPTPPRFWGVQVPFHRSLLQNCGPVALHSPLLLQSEADSGSSFLRIKDHEEERNE